MIYTGRPLTDEERDMTFTDAQSRSLAALPGRAADLAPEPYEMLGPINIVLRQVDGGFIASFVEANVNASGDTQNEALEMVKDMILSTFEWLANSDDSKLGPGPLRQKQVLSALIRQID